MKQLNDASIELGKAVYEAAAGEAGDASPAGADAPKGDDDVIDAEYEVKD